MYKGFIFCVLNGVLIFISAHCHASEQKYVQLNHSINIKHQNESTDSSISVGQAIYNKTCIACHGADGRGVAPSYPDFTQKGGVLSQPYNVLLHNITNGIGAMPAKGGYPALTDKEMEASLNYIRNHFAPEQVPEVAGNQNQEIQLMKQQIIELSKKLEQLEAAQNKGRIQPTASVSENRGPKTTESEASAKNANYTAGEVIFRQNCTACHGTNGKGVAPSFPDFTKKGGVLSQPAAMLLHHITYGIGAMPPKGGNPSLSDNDLKAALDYIEIAFALKQKSTVVKTITPVTPKTTKPNSKVESSKPVQVSQSKEQSSQSNNEKAPIENEQNNVTKTSYFWPSPDVSGLFTGGASAGYSVPSNQSGSFNVLDFNPLFLFRYKDFLLMESSVDFSLDDDANTNVSLDTLNFNLMVNDAMVFGIGAFDSPLGYFVQNLSPSWINKLPTLPAGFDSDEAAPQSQLGSQLRGGFYLFSNLKMNYIAFVANGPRAYADDTTGLIDYISTDPFPNNYGNFIGGGRVGILPIPDLEIGLSGAGGKLALFDLNSNLTLGEPGRDYTSLGADLSFRWRNWDLRAEVIKQQVGSLKTSLFPQGAGWKAWYLQAAYLIPATKLQPVVRWGGYTSPVSSQSQHQVTLGLDYWFAPSLALQAAYEFNNGQAGTDSDSNLFLIQLVYGF